MTSKAMKDAEDKPKSSEPAPHSPLTYNSYLKVDEIKQLQICQSSPPHHDEPLFIIIHQSYELWFKLVLHELDMVFELMAAGNVRRCIFYMRRVVAILKVLVQQIHILETMSPKDFLGFRYNLNPASGFQSSQFREIEFAGGLKEPRMLEHFRSDPTAYENLRRRFEQPSLQDAFYDLLRGNGFNLSTPAPDASEEVVSQCEDQRVRELLKLYNDQDKYGELHDLAETLIDFDELIFLWRTHHVTVVERIIGFKRGTGGSEGVGYLRTTLVKRCFPDLWKLRTVME